MIELINIILQIFVFILLFSFPINQKIINTSYFSNFSYFDIIFVNFIIFASIGLVFSILNLNFKYLFFIFLIFGIFNVFYGFNDFKKLKIETLILILFLVINFILFCKIASEPILNWDGLATWSLKMNNFYYYTEYENLNNITYSHQPHLGPYLWALFSQNNFLNYEYFGRLIYPFIFVLSIFSACSILTNKKNEFKLFLLIPVIIFLSYDKFLFGGYQEYIIFSITLFISKILYDLFSSNEINFHKIIIILMCLNLLIWTKQEGFAYSFLILFILLLDKKLYLSNKIFILLIFCFLLIIKFKFSFNSLLHDPHFIFNDIIDINFTTILYKFLFISKHILIAFIKYPIWILIILCFVFSVFTKEIKEIYLKKIILFGILNILLIYGVFLTTTSNFEWLVKVTLDRMVFQTTGFYLILIFIYFKYFFKKTN